MTKKCSKCRVVKPLNEFWKNAKSKDGYRPDCKACYGKPARKDWECRNCGGVDRNKWGACVSCKAISDARWRADNADKERERSRRWADTNPEKIKEGKRRWRASNPEKAREGNRRRSTRWRANNPDKVRENSQKWRVNNPDKARAAVSRWQKNNPEKHVANQHRRRTRKTQAGGSYTAAEFKALCEQYDNRCLCCGRSFDEVRVNVDHIIPISSGGTSNIDNLQPLCQKCNFEKHDKIIDYRKLKRGTG